MAAPNRKILDWAQLRRDMGPVKASLVVCLFWLVIYPALAVITVAGMLLILDFGLTGGSITSGLVFVWFNNR